MIQDASVRKGLLGLLDWYLGVASKVRLYPCPKDLFAES